MKSVARVMMKEGRPVRSTSRPLIAPTLSANRSDTASAGQMFQLCSETSKATIIPLAPIIEPIERSNSPPIISRQTASERMPSSAATCR
jgi:hypothetical protein